MSFWTKLRDTVESVAVVAGNYFLPGSSLLTSRLVSEGSQKQLSSPLGTLAQLGSGGGGAYAGNLANYGDIVGKIGSAVGLSGSGGAATGADAVAAFNAGKISAAEFEGLANAAGTSSTDWLSGKNLMAALPYAASAIGGITSANAATQAANTQAAAANRAADLQYQQWREQVGLQEPWRQAGVNALAKLQTASDYTPFGTQQFQADPGYGFRMSEGLKALDRQAAARGGLISGGALKAAQRYGQDLASQEYQNAFNRYQTERQAKLGPLQSLAGIGQTATQQLGQAGQTMASNVGNLYTDIGSAQSAGQLGRASAYTNAFNTGLNFYGQQQQNQLLMDLLKNRQPIGG